jgi:hypothetical protein
MDRRALAFLLCIALLASACGSDVTPEPSGSPGESPTLAAIPTASPPVTPSPEPTAPPLDMTCAGADKTPGKHSPTPITEHSQNWAGYIDYDRHDKFTCIQGSWMQPTVSCPTTGREDVAIWVGIDGVDDPTTGIHAASTLVQIGTHAGCDHGKATGFAWYQVIPKDEFSVAIDPVRPSPGDSIRALVRFADGAFTLQLVDETSRESFVLEATVSGAKRQTVEWIVEAPTVDCPSDCHVSALPKFGKVVLGDAAAASGSQLGRIDEDAWRAVLTDMIRSGVTRASVTKLNGGDTFTVTWRHR